MKLIATAWRQVLVAMLALLAIPEVPGFALAAKEPIKRLAAFDSFYMLKSARKKTLYSSV